MTVDRHSRMSNVLWCDGHVKAMKLETLATPGTNTSAMYYTSAADPN